MNQSTMDFTKFNDNSSSTENSEINGAEESEIDDAQMDSTQHESRDDMDSNKEEEEESGDNDDSDSDENEEEEAILVAEINRLQEELSFNPLDYNKNVLFISKLKSIGDLELLRGAREKMNKHYPLSAQLWLDWITDEKKIASSNEEKMAVVALFDRAVSEYLDSNLWNEYIQFSVELFEDNVITLDDARKVFNRALHHIGYSVAHGSVFWQYYRLLESQALGTLSTCDDEKAKEPVKSIFNLFRRQLSIPLLKMEESYKEFEKWFREIEHSPGFDLNEFKQDLTILKSDYGKALKSLEPLKVYEASLSASPFPHLEEYLKYIDFEMKSDNLARTQCLFERAITDNCLNSELWLKYLKYCDSKLVVDKLLLPVYERAIRNCPWVADIWVQYMLALEALSQPDTAPDDTLEARMWSTLEQAMKNAFNSPEEYKKLWLTYLHFTRRRALRSNAWTDEQQIKGVRETFESVINSLEGMSNLEYCYDLYHYFAKVEAKYCKSIDNARKIFNDIINRSATLKRQASVWLNFANLELMYGQEEEYRKVLHKGLSMSSEDPKFIGDILLRFEEEEGQNVEQYRLSLSKYETARKKFNERRSKEEKTVPKVASTQSGKAPPGKSLKRKAQNDADSPKKATAEGKKKKVQETPTKEHGTIVKSDDAKREQTIFVSNLNFELTQEEISDAFTKFGPINEIRLVRDFKGRSKGFCYVEFEKIESSRKALLHDRMLLNGRPAFITEMDKKAKFAYSTAKEKNKLFVKNIPFEYTKEDLRTKVFADYSESIVDIRIVTFRNGHSKGLAYVEMQSAAIAEKAVKEKNDFEIDGRQLSVAISDPSFAGGACGTRPMFSTRGQPSSSSSALMMIPRAAKSAPSKVKMQLDADFKRPDVPVEYNATSTLNSGDSAQAAPKMLCNDQFRSFLKK